MPQQKAKPRGVTPTDADAAARLKGLWLEIPSDRRPTQEAIAHLWGEGANQSLISQYMTGRIALNYRAVLKFSTILGCNPNDIRSDLIEQRLDFRVGETHSSYGDWADVVGYAQAVGLGSGAEAQEYAETHKLKFRNDSLRRKGLRPPALAVYYGHGDSMEPRIRAGDAILFDTSDTTPSDDAIFIVQSNGEIHAKRCEIIEGAAYFRSDNPPGDHSWRKPRRMDNPQTPITVVGRVRWIGSWED